MRNQISINHILGAFFLAIVFVSAGYSQASVALEGLDPVHLTEGKESLGKTTISVTRGRFQYFFSSEETRDRFQKDPGRYEIQLGGSCARMGPQVGGNPDLFSVHDGRIYIFGSNDCKQNFDAAPSRYLAPPVPEKLEASDQAFKSGRALIEKVVEQSGGARRFDEISGYRLASKSVIETRQGTFDVETILTRSLPDQFRLERIRPFGKTIDILTPKESFQIFIRNDQQSTRELPSAYAEDLAKQLRLTVLDVLLARNGTGFSAALVGDGKAGDTPVKIVEVLYRGVHSKLGIDPSKGRILTMIHSGRNESTGEIGEVVESFSDFREVNGVILPFGTDSTLDGKRQNSGTMKIDSILLNPKMEEEAFRRP